MKQILQNLRTGQTELADVPSVGPRRGELLIRTSRTLVSAGTERMLVEFGKAGWIAKARQQPDKVRMVLDKMRTDGLVPTLEAVFNKLDQPLPLGYCNVGTVLETGAGLTGYSPGDRVVSNGRHAQVVSVPPLLAARVPANVSDEAASFTVLGAIALQGIRLVQPTLGETVAVTGLGLIGLVTVQLLRAHGCKVIGIEFDPQKLALAKRFGADVVDLGAGQDPVSAARSITRERGVDAVIITASTPSNEPVHQAALMCRKRGRIVLVGVTGLELSRADFYEKELTFQVSCSYGPGRYDPNYEERGQDYPIGFVRWTEQRNFEAVLDMLADGRLDVAPLITHRIPLERALEAYDLVAGGGPSLGIVMEYPDGASESDDSIRKRTVQLKPAPVAEPTRAGTAFIGSGNYATAALIPAFRKANVRLSVVASSGGVSGLHAARKFGFERATTDVESIWSDQEIGSVIVSTRHDSHAALALRALQAGKHVFVEKPLCLERADVDRLEAAQSRSGKMLMVGFNRRFAPHVREVRRLLAGATGPRCFVMTVNAGAIPAEHWAHDPRVGGGRIVGEACHFIDLLRFLAESPIASWHADAIDAPGRDSASIGLRFANGSIGTVHYLANGSKAYPKERLEVFSSGRVLRIDNFRRIDAFGWPGAKALRLWRQDKGQGACARAFVEAVATDAAAPIPPEEVFEVARLTIDIQRSLQ